MDLVISSPRKQCACGAGDSLHVLSPKTAKPGNEQMQTIFRGHLAQLAGLIVLSGSLAACGGGAATERTSAATDAQTATPSTPAGSTPPVMPAPGPTPTPTPTPTPSPSPAPTPTPSPSPSPAPSPSPTPTPSPTPSPAPVPGNHAPTISGAPAASVISGQAYSFTPAAADADNDSLTFAISSKPAWATFSTATGRLSGTPTSAQTGSYEEIEISVSDGKVVTKLPQFAIVVSPAAITTRSVHMSWQPPLTNTDGSALTDLKGYRIVYGTQPGVYTTSVTVNGVGIASYTIDNLQTGKTYYFSMVSVNNAGTESPYSTEVVVNLT